MTVTPSMLALVADQAVDGRQRLWIQIAVDNFVLVATFEQGAERQQRQRHDRLAPGGAGGLYRISIADPR